MAYSDAAFGNLSNGGSQGAYLVFLVDDQGKCNLISWQSKRIKRVVRSSLAAETLALSDCIDGAVFISSLYSEIVSGNCHDGYLPVEIITDNKSLVASIESEKAVTEKRLRIDISAIKEAIDYNDIDIVSWVPTNKQLANALTKQGASTWSLMQTLHQGILL